MQTRKLPETLKRWVTGWKFPAAALSLLLSVSAFIGVILLIPETDGPLGRFARDFRLYCFGFDLKSGRFPWSEAILFFLDPLVIAGIIFFFWRKNLLNVPRMVLLRTGFTVFFLTFASGGLLAYTALGSRTDLSFPAERLRTSFGAPAVRLTDQNGQTADIAAHRGRVVVLTGFYTHCSGTCPAITGQLKRMVQFIPEAKRRDLAVFAVTMTPESDTVERLHQYSEGREMRAPLYRLLTGPSSQVSKTLDLMGVTRSPKGSNGQVDHANVILVVDRQGKVAYRFSIGELQEKWFNEAVLLLLDEAVK